MFRAPLTRAVFLAQSPSRAGLLFTSTSRTQSNAPAKAPEKIEVFIDDQPVLVAPGTTVLQVKKDIKYFRLFID